MDRKKKKKETDDDYATELLVQTNKLRPLEKSFEFISWTSAVSYEDVCRVLTHMDTGSSLVHACLNAICIPYRDGKMYNQQISQIEFVHMFRRELASALLENVSIYDETKYVELLGHGSWVAMESTDIDVLMSRLITPSCEFDPVMTEHLSNVLDKDIFIIDSETEDILLDSDEPTTRYKKRQSIVVLKVENHYELLAIRKLSGEFITHFDTNHPWIQKLHSIIVAKTS